MIFSKTRNITFLIIFLLVSGILAVGVYAQVNTTFRINITAAALAVSIVDASAAPVSSPQVAFTNVVRSSNCFSTTGELGVAAQKIRIANPGAADDGWTLTLAASAVTALWTSDGDNNKQFDFNDAGNSGSEGCSDKSSSGDTDTLGGQLTVDPSSATLTGVSSAATTGITKGTSASFVEGTTDSITLLTAASSSVDFGTWDLTGIDLTQKIPGGQDIASDYELSLTLTVAAQ